jgi:signal transduction histidine kinase
LDTKWKNRTLFLLYSLLLVIGLSGPLTIMDQGSRYLYRDYYRTPEFRQQLEQFATYLNLFELNSLSAQELKAAITVSEDDILDYRNQLEPLAFQIQNIHNEYDSLILEAVATDNSSAADSYKAQRDNKLEEQKKVFEDNDYALSLIRKEKERQIDDYYNQREMYRSEYLYNQDLFNYYFRNPSTGMVHSSLSNADDQVVAQNELYGDSHVYATNYSIDIVNSAHYMFGARELLDASILPYKGWIAVPKDSPLQEQARKYRWEQIVLLAYGVAAAVLLVACFIRFKRVMSIQAERSQWTTYYRKLPLDAKLLFSIGSAALTLGLLANLAGHYSSIAEEPLFYGEKLIVTLAIAAISMALTLIQGKFLVQDLHSWSKFGEEWKRSLLQRGGLRIKAGFISVMNQVRDSFIYKNTGIRLLLLSWIWICLGFIGGWMTLSFFQYNDSSFVLVLPILAIVGLVVFLLTTRRLGYLNKVAKAADELAAGRMPDELPQSGSDVLASLASNINALRRGVTLLQNEQAKSERLKTELITNVSHDLRTPLTSIITYAGLLKTEDATVEERAAYVDIINQKSKRLKTMIDDLFEVSRMASGNAKLILEKSDLVQLMQQALAEYKEDMDGSDVQFRVSLPAGPLFVLADGQKLWRAFDNLIGNMLKYSLSHTRAYISMQLSESQEVAITFKNVSKYEISDNADELFERFKRGDTSRHTEGAGLGLAIAKSIIDLHEGRLTLETDGDLFKVSITLKLQVSAKRAAPDLTAAL